VKAIQLPRGDGVVATRQGYDRWAAVYEHDGNPLTHMEAPVVRELLGDVAGRRILDVGCGTGRHALALAAAGARVTGVDFSEGMLAEARKKPGAEAVELIAHDLTAPLPFPDASFDRVINCLVVEHIADLDRLLGEMRRVCRRDGFAVLTAMHPAMMLIGKQAAFRDPATNEHVYPQSHPHQLSDFVMAAVRAGWRLDHMSEHAVGDELAAALPRAAKYHGWLMLLALRLA
jgi:malonyl-CoA O-methyltransferase